ncbi:MAG: hypothetical protein N2510_05410 [Ignavibacteria bacterium]|nr:hypothetical protein [Ignavibacteria bacterium]
MHITSRTFLIISVTLILAYFQTVRVDAPNYELKKTRHGSIINNSIEYPYKYRVLNPYITDIWIRLANLVLSDKNAFLIGYFIQNMLVYAFMIFSVCMFFSLWFNESGILVSTLFFSLLIPLSLTGYDTLGDMTTCGLMALSFYFTNTRRFKFLFPLISISAFNELQGILISVFYFFSSKDNLKSRKAWLNTIGLILVFVFSYSLIYLIRGGEFSTGDIKWYFTKDAVFNLTHGDWVILWMFMIGPLLPFAIKNFKPKPEFLKRAFIYVLPAFYLFSFFFIGRMREIDKAMTIFLILIPMAFMTIFPSFKKDISSDGVST